MWWEKIRPMFLRGDAEEAHERVVRLLEKVPLASVRRVPRLPVTAMGLRFRHPLGMAAGFDKDARVVPALQRLGFAFVEAGTVTPRPQEGNPRPRLWRVKKQQALVNALGFPSEGAEAVRKRLEKLRAEKTATIPVGINIGKNRETPLSEAADDYVSVLKTLYEWGDFFVVNVSSPNTPGLRDLQSIDSLRRLLESVMRCMTACGGKPLLVKIAPDLADEDVVEIGKLAKEIGLSGLVAANTTVRRELGGSEAAQYETGGLSGPPLFSRTCELIRLLRGELRSDQTIIAVGGISSSDDVRRCLDLGADLVQVYTAFIYLGPHCASKLLRDIQ